MTRFLSLFSFFLIAATFSFSSCGDRGTTNEDNHLSPEVLSNYVSGYTSGVIGKNEAVRIQFAQEMITSDQVGTIPPANAVSISPSFEGTISWENDRTLVAKPASSWDQGEEYTLIVSLEKLFPTAKDISEWQTSFTIRQTQLTVNPDGLYTPNSVEPTTQILTGSIIATDAVNVTQLKGFLTASMGNTDFPVSYRVDPNNDRRILYEASGIRRSDEAAEIKLSWDASKINGLGTAKGQRVYQLTSANSFELLGVNFVPEGDPHIQLRFSDPVSTSQDLTGLVRLGNSQNNRIQIDANVIRLYVNNDISGTQNVRIDAGLKNSRKISLGEDINWEISFTRPNPEIRVASDGAIMPHTGRRLFPFEAIGLEAVRVEVFKIYANNVQQYLLSNTIEGQKYNYGMSSVGRIVHQERVLLQDLNANGYDMDSWNRYAVDLGRFIAEDDRSIYQIRIGFALEDARKDCGVTAADFGITANPGTGEDNEQFVGFDRGPASIFGDYYGIYNVRYEGFSWEDRDDPCKPAYYNADRFVSRNVLSSNLGLIVKQNNDRQTVVLATDLISGGPNAGASITLYDEQQQQIAQGNTDTDGRWLVETERQPTFVVAKKGEDIAYLTLNENAALNTSRFNTAGQAVAGGVKGTFYTERGVWRPGDSVFLNFVLENRLLKLPSSYPVTFTLTDSRGNVRETRTATPTVGQIYPLYFNTDTEDPTGNWTASVEAGGQTYRRTLKIETVKPNRLKVDLKPIAKGPITAQNRTLELQANWLHGAPAANMRADVKGQLQEAPGLYKENWPAYSFSDPARKLIGQDEDTYFDDELSAEGSASFELANLGDALPGPMRMAFTTRVFEPGGDFSADNVRYELATFDAMAGMSIPTDRWGSKRLLIGKKSAVSLAAITPEGKGISGRKLTIGLYRVNWRYWWQDDNDNVSKFNSSSHEKAIETFEATTASDGRTTIDVSVPNWGRYLLRVCDETSGHCSGDYFYAGSPRWTETDKDAAAMLPLRMEAKNYAIGEQANITVASETGGMVLLTIENGQGVLETRWVDAAPGETVIPINTDERMVPNVYASVMLIQPHADTKGNRPIRQYGIIPISVENPDTRLTPTIATATEYEPEENFSVTVAENDGKPMNYTIAVVDEGLLGLTRFQTPDLWKAFFAKEALSVRTYDLYNKVIGSMDGQFNRILAVGGGGEDGADGAKPKANRFKPVVMHLGPFSLAAGTKATHDFTMPNYVGAVRVMVVAEGGRNYGSASESIPVRKDLMVLPTLPRVIGPGESIELPVNVFAMTGKVKDVTVKVSESSGLVTSVEAMSRALRFDAPGDQLVRFPFKVGDRTGIARFTVTASGNGESISQEIEIDVRNPNPFESRSQDVVLAPGEEKVTTYNPFGSSDNRTATLEISTLPPLNLEKHLRYLIRYPYGCAEQTTSPAFAQVHLDKLVDLNDVQKREVRNNVQSAISRLVNFQRPDGGMAYWPGGDYTHPWASNYILHFFLEAEAAGYTLPISTKKKLLDFQQKAVSNWRSSSAYNFYESSSQKQFDHAYRLFTLALAGKADVGAMNRLRNVKNLHTRTLSFLAAAYGLAGQASVAQQLVNQGNDVIDDYQELSHTFGSSTRDKAIVLSVYAQLGLQDKAGSLALNLAKKVGKKRRLNTQEAAFVITAFSKYADYDTKGGKTVNVDYVAPGGSRNQLAANTGIIQVELPTDGSRNFTLRNNGNTTIYGTVVLNGQPLPGEEQTKSAGLNLDVRYEDLNGNPVNIDKMKSGTDFVAVYELVTTGDRYRYYQNIALQQIAASGWEISNERMNLMEEEVDGQDNYRDRITNTYDYRDYRDDQVNTFFNIRRGHKKVFRTRLTAAYPGRYYLPTQLAEAMYDAEVMATVKGRWVEVD